MDNDTRGSRRRNFLLRQVVVPSWVQGLLLVGWGFMLATLLASYPLLVIVALVSYAVFSSIGASRESLRTRRTPISYREVDVRAALSGLWREMCTYQMWMLIVVSLVVACAVMSYLGILPV